MHTQNRGDDKNGASGSGIINLHWNSVIPTLWISIPLFHYPTNNHPTIQTQSHSLYKIQLFWVNTIYIIYNIYNIYICWGLGFCNLCIYIYYCLMMESPIAVTCIHTCGLHTQWILCLLHSVFILSHTSPTSIHDDKPFYLFHYEQCSDVDSNTLQAPNHKPHLTLPLTPKKKDFKCKFNAQYSDPESSHRDFYSEKKNWNSQSTTSELYWIWMHIYQYPQSNWRLPTRLLHAYSTHQPPLPNNWKFWSHISYYCVRSILLSAGKHFGIT